MLAVLVFATSAHAVRWDEVKASENLAPQKKITLGAGSYFTGPYAPYITCHEVFFPAAAPSYGTFSNGTTTGTAYKKTATWTQPGEYRNIKLVPTKFVSYTGLEPPTVHGHDPAGNSISETPVLDANGVGRTNAVFRDISSVVSPAANNAFASTTSIWSAIGGKRIGFVARAISMTAHKFNGVGSATPPSVDTTFNGYSSPSTYDGSKREDVYYKARIEPYQ